MTTIAAQIRNEAGIHCRPSAVIVKAAMGYAGQIVVTAGSGSCDVKSIMGLLALGLGPEEKIIITVTGPDEKAFANQLKALFETRFDFPPRGPDESSESLVAGSDP